MGDKESLKEALLVQKLQNNFRESVLETNVFKGEVTHVVRKEALRAICNFLKSDPELRMNYLVDVLGVDYYPNVPRFEVVYHLYSVSRRHRVRLKVRVNEGEAVPTVADIWSAADWPEREAYDMFGIVFEGHPNLKRIYLSEDWEGHPMRKDYPLRGFKDRYNPYGEEKD